MKALTISLERFMELKQKKTLEPDFQHTIYDLVELEEDFQDLKLINENWVKVKVKLGGICGSDMHIMALRNSTVLSNFASFPAIPGHEIVGNIVELGENVQGFSIGDKVICDTNLSCEVRGLEKCPQCENGDYNLCSNTDKGDIQPGLILGLCSDTGGAWGEYVVVHKSQLFKIPEEAPFEEVILAEPLACALHGVLKIQPKEGDNVVVIGCGTIGLATIIALKYFSKCNIIATAKYKYQADLAEKLGADKVFMVKKDLHIKKIAKELGCRVLKPVMEDAYPVGGGADIVIDSVGNPASIANSLRLVKPRGRFLLLGYPAYIEVDWSPMMAKEITTITSNIFSYDVIDGIKKRSMQIAVDLIASDKVNVKDLVTHKFSVEEYKEALEVAENKSKHNAVKVVFRYE